jgi:hypothetical protein
MGKADRGREACAMDTNTRELLGCVREIDEGIGNVTNLL